MSTEYNIFGAFTKFCSLSYKWVSIFKKIIENAVIVIFFNRNCLACIVVILCVFDYLICICYTLCAFVISYVYLLYLMCIYCAFMCICCIYVYLL